MEKLDIFPNLQDDKLISINNIDVKTDFSKTGDSLGIQLHCEIIFKTKKQEILMNPDWEEKKVTDKVLSLFPNGHYIFEYFKEEKLYFTFFAKYEPDNDDFVLTNVKKNEDKNCYFLKSIQQRYTYEAFKKFQYDIYKRIIKKYVKKVSSS